jgi:chaperone modulatory protein CbpM
MSHDEQPVIEAVIVESDLQFSLPELCRACGVDAALLEALVHEGALTPLGDAPAHWRFAGTMLARARMASRLSRDLELSASGTALVLDLLDEIGALRAQLQRLRS